MFHNTFARLGALSRTRDAVLSCQSLLQLHRPPRVFDKHPSIAQRFSTSKPSAPTTSPPKAPSINPPLNAAPPPPSSISALDIIKSFPIGFAASSGGACAGIGGSLFSIPLLTHFTSLVDQRVAAGTAIFAVMATSSGSTWAFFQQDKVCFEMAIILCTTAGIAAPVGAWVSKKLHVSGLQRILGGFLLLTAPMLWIKEAAKRHVEKKHAANKIEPVEQVKTTELKETKDFSHLINEITNIEFNVVKQLPLMAIGSAIGFISGLLGVGGGMLFTPTIALLSLSDFFIPPNYADSFDFRTVLGTSFASMFLPAITTAVSYTRMHAVRFSMVPGLTLGAFAGAKFGSYYALRLDEDLLRVVFTGVFGALAWRYLRKPIK